MKNYKQQFKGKKITIMGLGILGRGVGYTKFLAECGADLIVTDLKTKEQLRSSLKELKKYKNIKYTLGGHKLKDFRNRDMIIKAAGVPLDSIYIKEAKKNKIPVEMDVSLFIKSAPKIKVVGVTGTRGKSMTTQLIYEILKKNIKNKEVLLGGNVRGVATLPFLENVREGDILVCELDSWQLQGFGEDKISPNVSVFTTFMPDHMDYYKDSMKKYFADKANIFKYQKKDDVLITSSEMKKFIKKSEAGGKFIIVNPQLISNWKFNVPGEHHRRNLAYAVEVAKQFKIPVSEIKTTIASFKGLEGRLQLLRTYKGIKIYNDNNATTPTATIAGLEALASSRPYLEKISGSPTSRTCENIILICGGSDKGLPLANFVKVINKNCKSMLTIPGNGTDRLLKDYKIKVKTKVCNGLEDAIKEALTQVKRGDVILFSPAFASFGAYNNEYERNDEFVKIIKELK